MRKSRPTAPQARQRGLAWLLYVTEGASANIAGAMNLAQLRADERAEIERTIARLDMQAARLRAAFTHEWLAEPLL